MSQFFKLSEWIDASKRVEAGSAWLDDTFPGWEKQVSKPNIVSQQECLLCQLTESLDWFEAKGKIKKTSRDLALMGLDKMMCFQGGEFKTDDYETLESLWQNQINKRLNPE